MPRRTPLHAAHVAAGGRMVDFAGWEMPQQYSSVREEHAAVRSTAGLFDVSHMGRVEVHGAGAGAFLQSLVTNDLSLLEPGRSQYNLMCNEAGGIVDDLVVYRGPGGEWSIVLNASNRDKDLAWMRERAGTGVEVVDRSDETALLAYQGPRAAELLPSEGVDLAAIPYFGLARGAVAGVPATLSRTGYTGEDGFELFLPAESAAAAWEAILDAGARGGAVPAGLAARDVCRLEAGLRLYGNDMDDSTDPYSAGLGWTVKLGKGDFVGREALLAVQAAPGPRRLVGVRGEGRTIPRHGARLLAAGSEAGEVTSGTFSFFLERGIGMAYVDTRLARAGTRLELDGRVPAALEVASLPFYRGSVRAAART